MGIRKITLLKTDANECDYKIAFTNRLDSFIRTRSISRAKGKLFETSFALVSLGIMAGCSDIKDDILGIDENSGSGRAPNPAATTTTPPPK